MKRNKEKVEEKPCACEVHVRLEASDGKEHIPCLGHGVGCPCTEKQLAQQNDGVKENAEIISKSEQQT